MCKGKVHRGIYRESQRKEGGSVINKGGSRRDKEKREDRVDREK